MKKDTLNLRLAESGDGLTVFSTRTEVVTDPSEYRSTIVTFSMKRGDKYISLGLAACDVKELIRKLHTSLRFAGEE